MAANTTLHTCSALADAKNSRTVSAFGSFGFAAEATELKGLNPKLKKTTKHNAITLFILYPFPRPRRISMARQWRGIPSEERKA
jgi:hypothetical protein